MPDFLRVEDGAVRSWFFCDKESCGRDRVAPNGLGNELVGHQDPPCRGKPRPSRDCADERPMLDRDRAVVMSDQTFVTESQASIRGAG